MLEPRDQVLEHEFNFNINLNDPHLFSPGENIIDSNFYIELKRNIKKFLVEAVSNVVSVGFKFLCKNELS